MKKFLTFLIFGICQFVFAQISIPQTSPKGTIVTITNLEISYQNLELKNDKVNYINVESGNPESLYINSIKSIIENFNKENPSINESLNQGLSKMEIQEKNRNYLQNPDYIKAKKISRTGTMFMVLGGATFVGGGLYNVAFAPESTASYNGEKHGSSIPLIIGLAGVGAGLVMKIVGGSKMNKIKSDALSANYNQKEYYLVTNQNGLGLQVKF